MTVPGTPSPLPADRLPDVLQGARWFGGKGRAMTVQGVTRLGELPTPGEPRVVVDLVEVRYDDAEGGTERYQLPLALYTHPQERLAHAFVSWHDEGGGATGGERWQHAYDAVQDREAMAVVLAAFDAAEAPGELGTGGLVVHRLPGHALDTEAVASPFSGEQSNSSVVFGDDALLKAFRRVTPGVNPDVEIHDVLTRAGSEHVASLYGWLEVPTGEGPLQLAMLQQFLRTASDGWELAFASMRDLLAESALSMHAPCAGLAEARHAVTGPIGIVRPDAELADAGHAGGDFAEEARRLGAALAEVHADLAERFGTVEHDAAALARLADRMTARLDEALPVVPQLHEHAPRLRATFAAVAGLPGVRAQRVHGDLHLGQTLRTVRGWKLVDFEGEPAKPLAERSEPDSPWRDVAGMLRSFDYAASVAAMQALGADAEDESARRSSAADWAARNRAAFLDGYAGDDAIDEADAALLAAYVADKAVYEAVYEARNRPSWLGIPLAALADG